MLHAATQHNPGSMVAAALTARLATPQHLLAPVIALRLPKKPMIRLKLRQFSIQGVTKDGKSFRPSDWAERLAGAMSCFRPGGSAGGISAAIGYSPYCVPHVLDGVKCVIVSEELRDVEPMAWDFVMNFGRDNDLQVHEISDAAAAPKS